MDKKSSFRGISALLMIISGVLVSACNSTPTPEPSPSPSASQASSGGTSNADQKINFSSAPSATVQLNSCNPVTLQVENAKTSAPEAANADIYVSFYFTNAIAYSDSGCNVLIGSYIFQTNQQTQTVYYKPISLGQTKLELSSTDTTVIYDDQISYTQTVQVGAPVNLQMSYSTAILTNAVMPAVSVCVVDNLGNIIAQAGTEITIQLASNPSQGTLSGTLTEATGAGGCAAFDDLSLNLSGVYTIQASEGNLIHTSGNITASSSSGVSAGSGTNPSPSSGASPSPSPSPTPTVDCTNIANANVTDCYGTDPSYCLNPTYANFAPCSGAFPSYCSSSGSTYSTTLACTGSNPSGLYCDENPSALGCPEYCDVNPNAQQCPNFCNQNPTAAGCPEYCDVNPTAQGCPEYCDVNPTGQGCAIYCDENPTAQGCPDYCTFNPTSQGCPEFCDVNPTSQGCPLYCDINPTAQGC